MTIKVYSDLQAVNDVLSAAATIGITVTSNLNVNNLMSAANKVVQSAFIIHMTEKSLAEPKRFAHMYEWNRIGDPNSRLWIHKMNGRGRDRTLTFTFKASVTAVPVDPKLKSVGVQSNHIFYWKAMIMELGMPVHIAPTLAKVLVFLGDDQPGNNSRSTRGTLNSWINGGVVYHRGQINITKAGNEETWGAFTEEFALWFGSIEPSNAINSALLKPATETIKSTFFSKVKELSAGKTNTKSLILRPIGLDPSFQSTLENILSRDYTAAGATRKVLTDE